MGAMVLDNEYRVLFWNKRLESWTHLKKEEIEGRDIRTIFPNFLDPKISLRLEIVFQGGPPAVFSTQLHRYLIPAPLPENKLRLQHTMVNAVRSLDGSKHYAFFTIDDVTDAHQRLADYGKEIESHRHTEKALHEAIALAQAANKAKSEFLANMSHEIRTPLNGILGMLQLLQHSPLSLEQNEWVSTALQSGASLVTILGDVLDISKIEAGVFELQESEFRVTELLESLSGAFGEFAAQKRLRFECRVEPGVPPRLVADAGRIRQILFNLVGNALKFTSQGEVLVTVSALLRQGSSQWLLFTVQDTGIGVSPERVDYIFEPFTQIDGSYSRKYGGLGLGLGIVKRLVSLMGGSLTVESEEGAGASLYCSLRARLPENLGLEELYASDSPLKAAPTDANARGSLRILLAEDEQVNQLVLSRLLEKLGHTTRLASNGREALQTLSQESFDLIIMDIQMPELDGVETTRRIRQGAVQGANPSIPILAVTAHAIKGDKQRFLDSGMDGYLSKPIQLAELRAALARIAES
jgi:signal transduction histidine kinase/CheY-like chemotaxis protein